MRQDGFTDLTGIDTFSSQSELRQPGLELLKCDIYALRRQFDVIMLHHVFEHMPSPARALGALRERLAAGGSLVIRIPVASSFAYRHYGANWVQLDAPRHLFLHSMKSMELLTHSVGLQIIDVVFDSTEFQFLGSEQYMMGIPLRDPRSFLINPRKAIFSQEDIARYREMACRLNAQGEGDSACFFLRAVE